MTNSAKHPHDYPVPAGTAGRWCVVPERSSARFHVRDKLVATVHGSLAIAEGSVLIAEDSTVTHAWLILPVRGIQTGNARRDKDLQKPQFLDAATSPTVQVVVESATATPNGFTATSTVRARGRLAPLALTIHTTTGTDSAPTAPPNEIRVRATGRLDRTALGIKAPSFIIGRLLDVEADLTLRRQPSP